MATMKDIGLSKALFAAEDLSEKLYYAAKMDSNGLAALADVGDVAYGIITESAIAGMPVTIQYGGEVKAIAGGSFAAGDAVAVGAGGKIVGATGSPPGQAFGIANEAGATNRIVSINLQRT